MPMPKAKLPLLNRTFERTQGCWNCKHFASADASLQHWLTACRPREDARISQAKQAAIQQPPHLIKGAIDAVERAVGILDGSERAIREGKMGLCRAPGSQNSDFKSDKFLCDRWSATQGASIARAGQKADDLPEELKDKHGDGN